MQHLPSEDRCLFGEDGSFRAIDNEDMDRVDTRLTAGKRKRVHQEVISADIEEEREIVHNNGKSTPSSSSKKRRSSVVGPEVEVIEID